MQSDYSYMTRALKLAAQGAGQTSPNPMVGCVIVKDDIILGEGLHERVGGAHAEVNAYRSCGVADTEGATVYVTLEPCTHTGRTPPCVDLLLERRPGRVVIAMEDPNTRVNGIGIARLRDAGIRTDVGICETAARRLNEIYIKHVRSGIPWVTAKCAMTLDGKIATRSGHSKWITGEKAREYTHRLRHSHDVILVGSRTIMVDNPRLTTRLPEGKGRHPIKVILDAGDYLSADRRVFAKDRESPTWIATTAGNRYDFADEIIVLPPGSGGVDLRALLAALAERGIQSVLIEGGGATLASAFSSDIVDKVCFFCAPKIIGGREAITPVEGVGCERMEEAILLDNLHSLQVGKDILMEALVKKRTAHEMESN
ncbi:MAG: bifunctional diaminohydroxyphosphoribosylaminopyrimidine deaminase/5-amino-6-(5-phosphoribosylamino)uracil reductase RibD [Candidatus Hydrogenedentes bacterium]|nr:bifunctional diaminohydroxyphosphoribosylaminopyrimidine deaminase/5-amino-6-(5-phosphoribosylamino)uracil reductase RibD [Candidatus Hydrogenedentota bacterium]